MEFVLRLSRMHGSVLLATLLHALVHSPAIKCR